MVTFWDICDAVVLRRRRGRKNNDGDDVHVVYESLLLQRLDVLNSESSRLHRDTPEPGLWRWIPFASPPEFERSMPQSQTRTKSCGLVVGSTSVRSRFAELWGPNNVHPVSGPRLTHIVRFGHVLVQGTLSLHLETVAFLERLF